MTEIQSSPSVQQQSRGDYVPVGQAPSSAGSSNYQDIVVERAGTQTKTDTDTFDTLSSNATLSKARPFGLGVDDSAIMAKIHEALSQLVNVDVTRRKLNRELTFMEADSIASKMKNAAELERKGAVLSLAMSVGGAGISIAGATGINFSRSAKNKELETLELQNKKLDQMYESAMEPRRMAMKDDGTGAIDPQKWDPLNHPPMRQEKIKHPDGSETNGRAYYIKRENGEDVELKLTDKKTGKEIDPMQNPVEAKKAAQEWYANKDHMDNWASTVPKYENPKFDAKNPANTEPKYITAKQEAADRVEHLRELGNTPGSEELGALKTLDKDELARKMGTGNTSDGIVNKLNKDLRVRDAASEFKVSLDPSIPSPMKTTANGLDQWKPTKKDADQLQSHEINSVGGYNDKGTTDELKKLTSADQMLSAWANVATLPGSLLQNVGNSASDLTFNKEAKELEAEATRDSATQSFFSDNAGTLTGEIQGALQGIDAVKGYIEVGSAVAGGIRA